MQYKILSFVMFFYDLRLISFVLFVPKRLVLNLANKYSILFCRTSAEKKKKKKRILISSCLNTPGVACCVL